MRKYKIEKKVTEVYEVIANSQDEAEMMVVRGEVEPTETRVGMPDLVEPSTEVEDPVFCSDCVNARPNGVCVLDLCTHDKVCANFKQMPEGESKTCECGWWTCGSRGCGDCPDCYGEYCECGM